MLLLITVTVCLIFLILLFQKINIKIEKKTVITVDLNFIFIAVRFSTSEKKEKHFPALRVIKNIYPIKKAFEYLLSKCEILLTENLFASTSFSNSSSDFKNITLFVTLYSILPLIKNRAKKFKAANSTNSSTKLNNDIQLSVYLSVNLIFVIISVLIFLYYKLRKKAKKEVSYGR